MSAQSQWGRIDDDGSVFVTTAEGEREIGSWQAGDAEAGLQFYARRYADLATEVRLLEKRLESGTADPASTRTQATAIKEQLPTAAVIGDIVGLDARLDGVLAAAAIRAGEAQAARETLRAEAIAAREALVAEAEELAASATQWKAAGDRLRTMVDEWKLVKGLDRKTDDAMWKRFAAARDAFGRRRGQHFAQLDTERTAAKQQKEKLIAQAEELSTSSDWRDTATAMRELMTAWKAAPRTARDIEDQLWSRFRAAQDAFFARRSETFSERDAEQVENQQKKEAIIAKAGAIDLSDTKTAQAQLRDLQADFDETGHVPRDAMRALDDRMRAAEQRVRDAVDAGWKTASMESNPFLAELRARLVEAEAKLERAQKSGDAARIKKAEDEVAARKSLLPQ